MAFRLHPWVEASLSRMTQDAPQMRRYSVHVS